MDFKNTTVKTFIEHIIKYENVNDILEECNNQSTKGFVFERLFDIVIKFGFCDKFENHEHIIDNVNNGKPKILTNFNKYLNEKVISGNLSGCSDITLKNKTDDSYIFISCKYPKTDEEQKNKKSIKYYDIQNIIAIASKHKNIYKNYKIYIAVPNKKKLLKKASKANISSNYITEHIIENNILDLNDLNIYFKRFKEDIIKNIDGDLQNIYLNTKSRLNLRFHQELITEKTNNLIKQGNKTFLWACKCRSGKTMMCGGIINKQFKDKSKLNVLVITPAPSETAPQFTNDLFNKFQDFNEFKIHHIEGSKMAKTIKPEKNNIFIMSKQLLQNYINDETINVIKNLNLDLCIFDESHFSGTTDLSKNIIKSYSANNTAKLFLTATYNKPLKEWNIPSECQMYWDIEDEQICKSIIKDEKNLERLKEKHGDEYIEKTLNYYSHLGLPINEIFKCYEQMPDLHIITNMFNKEKYDQLKKDTNNEHKMGFCFDTLFKLNSTKTQFMNFDAVEIILSYISSSHKEKDGPLTIYSRVTSLCAMKNSRAPFTQIWFLPSDNINEISLCLIELMKQDKILKKYDILCVNRKNEKLAKDIKDEINNYEINARENNKKGLILLAGNMLSLGITLNLCDLVILLNNSLSSDKVLQQMYRCMTEGENKKIGIVVDLNISRVLNTCINYSVHKKEENINDKISYLIKGNLINIDSDLMENKKINSDAIIKKLMEIWKNDPINSFRTLLKNLDNDYVNFDSVIQTRINKAFTKSMEKNANIKLYLKDEEDEIQSLKPGIINSNDGEIIATIDEIKDNTKEEKETYISFSKDVLPFIIPLVCILTTKNKNMDFIKMLSDISENKSLLETFDDQCLIWWNQSGLINFIKDIIDKYFDKNSNAYNISIQFKMSLQSLIDNPKELLELISECLKPKDIEKKQFGEVFTPMALVNEMLEKIPKEVWTNKDLKWLDPASGMGNFPIAIYLKLMESLKETIKDEKKRKKHILEKMLYMCELNKKNVLICKQIFDINDKYKLNIYEGDSLELNYEEYFKIKEFDVIVGNPPYQDANATGDNKLYLDFTKKCLTILKNEKYLLFITPRNILDYLLLFEKNRKYIDNFYQLKYIAIETSNKYFSNIGSTFVYFLIEKRLYYEKTIIEYLYQNKIETINIFLEIGFKIPRILTDIDIEILKKITSKTNYTLNDFTFKNKTQRIRKQHISKNIVTIVETDKNKIKIIDTINKSNPHPGKYYYYNLKDNDFDKDKLILSKKGYLMPFVDKTKTYTYSDNFKYIIGDDLDKIKLLLDSKIIKYLLFQYSKNGFDSIEIIKTIHKHNLNNIKNEIELYKLYGLSKDHLNHIDKILKNKNIIIQRYRQNIQ